jgi:hypothetical protein
MTLREEGKTIEEALDDKTEQLVLNTNPEEDKDGNETGT